MTSDDHVLHLQHGDLRLPAFLPDATRGVVRSLGAADLYACGTQALVMNTFHLMRHPGSSTVNALGGLHKMAGWPSPIFTDSGGFQAYSLIHENPRNGQITNNGLIVRVAETGRKVQLTPEKSIRLQVSFGSDVVFCLDDCTHVDAPDVEQDASVKRTVAWARRGKQEFTRLMDEKRVPPSQQPLLFAVIQGGGSRPLRDRCAQDLLDIGFDGYGFGGWPLDRQGALLEDILAYTRTLVPRDIPMHALGVGHPSYVARCFLLGYDLFDSALPTRDARHGRLYGLSDTQLFEPTRSSEGWLVYRYVNDAKYMKSATPISDGCKCPCCSTYTLGYLHHLFKIGDSLFLRLATTHNLWFMAQLMSRLGAATAAREEAAGRPR